MREHLVAEKEMSFESKEQASSPSFHWKKHSHLIWDNKHPSFYFKEEKKSFYLRKQESKLSLNQKSTNFIWDSILFQKKKYFNLKKGNFISIKQASFQTFDLEET